MRLARGMTAGVLGLGASGCSVVRFLLARGVRVKASEQRKADAFAQATLDELRAAGVFLETGGHSREVLDSIDFMVPSPGVPLDEPILEECGRRGIPVLGELALASEAGFSLPVIGVTGSNGKTTVTSLIGHLLGCAGRTPFIGGNIGTPLLDWFDRAASYDAIVLELSSFQLELAGAFRPDIGLLLNISPDHLDRHGTLARYAGAKYALFSRQRKGDIAIVGGDDPLALSAAVEEGVGRFTFGMSTGCHARVAVQRVELHLGRGGPVEQYDLSGTALADGVNRLNAAAAILAVRLAGVERGDIAAGLETFLPPPHRMEKVARVNGVDYINDSKATNIGALQAALENSRGPVVLIAGGRDKKSDFRLLREVVAAKVDRMILLGEAADLMAAALEGTTALERAVDMQAAVQMAAAAARPGATVLLAPGCASFDMFESYAHRGRVFASCVRQLAGKQRG